MTDLRKAAEMALEFVDWLCGDDHSVKPKNNALKTREALRQALAQPEQRPANFYLSPPPKREWVGLTKDEVDSWELPNCPTVFEFAQFIEAKLKEKNT